MLKIVKFGGSSVANANQFKKVKQIIEADSSRQFVVISASGKQNKSDYKITDLLYLLQAHIKYKVDFSNIFEMIQQRFFEIASELNLSIDIKYEMFTFRQNLLSMSEDEIVSRGEYYTAKLMADYLGYTFVDAKDMIFFKYDNTIDYEKIQMAFDQLVQTSNHVVIPGFYGALPDGSIQVMSRGGSDVTGSILANVMNANIYENWTDVSGILMADPRIISSPKEIDVINYSELRELSYMGASILHEEAIFPVKEKNIPIHILNTNDPCAKGTIIQDKVSESSNITITGIAGKKDFSVITIKKNHMSNEIGLIKKALDVFELYRISIEHIPSGIDSFSIVVESKLIKPYTYELMNKLKEVCQADEVVILENVSLIATVSRKMKNVAGMSGRLFTALGKKNISVAVIIQSTDEMNIIVGVNNNDYERTIQAIYEEFEGKR